MIEIVKNENGNYVANGEICALTGDGYIILPPNDMNRTYASIAKMEKKGFPFIIDKVKTAPVKGESAPKAPSHPWTEYLTEDERALYEELKSTCEKRAKADRIRKEIERLQKELDEQ